MSFFSDLIGIKPPAPPPMIARNPTPARTVYTAPKISYAPTVAAAPRAAAAPAAASWGAPAPSYTAASSGGGSSTSAYNAAQAKADAEKAKAEKEAKDRTRRENAATRALVDQQVRLSGSFGKQRDTKLSNISKSYAASDSNLLKGYSQALGGLRSTAKDNDRGEADSTFQNVANAVRERQDVLAEIGNNGGGETDMLRGQLAALRNYSNNQNEINRSFFDTLNSINRSITSLNVDTGTSRSNSWNQAEADREAAWANYYNQQSETWTQITNIENSNTNIDSSTSEAYKKLQPDSGKKAASYASQSYAKKTNNKLDTWKGKGGAENRKLTSTNRAATVNLGGPMKRAEGATLRKW
jgi:molybdopterin-guanine dinucleotide biosynthesis protein